MTASSNQQDSLSQVTSGYFTEVMRLISQSFLRKTSLLIPINQFSVLKVLEAEGHLTMSEVGDRLHLVRQQMTPLVDKLVRMGYIIRQGRANDKRYIDLVLTDEGHAFIKECNELLKTKIQAGLTALSKDELAVFAKSTENLIPLLKKIAEHQSKK
ncbi:MAG: MarR family transcriptional regulator [Schwartzia sp.]|nr:MarR family transcriptional regulator [Schwartzia sp. (in: firmicutes)]